MGDDVIDLAQVRLQLPLAVGDLVGRGLLLPPPAGPLLLPPAKAVVPPVHIHGPGAAEGEDAGAVDVVQLSPHQVQDPAADLMDPAAVPKGDLHGVEEVIALSQAEKGTKRAVLVPGDQDSSVHMAAHTVSAFR